MNQGINKSTSKPGKRRAFKAMVRTLLFASVLVLAEMTGVAATHAAPAAARDLHQDLHIALPASAREFPEPLAPGQSPGFRLRGTKGWAWTPEQYVEEIPWLVKFKLNFLMNCYLSMFDLENHPDWPKGDANRWWEPLPTAKKQAYEKVVKACQQNGIHFCFGMNPNLASKRMLNDGGADSIDKLFQHYAWMQGLGVKWFNVSLDDITHGIDASTQARAVNEIFQRLRAKDSEAQMIFCPTYYWGDGTQEKQQPYLEGLARELHKDIYLFWTGDGVVGKITRRGAETFRRIGGHRVFLWDNYPVNDGHPTLHLGPVVDRDADLCEVVDGYMGNPHQRESRINRLPLATCADYAYNPGAYDPLRSITQAILLVGETPAKQAVLRDMVETYPGMLLQPVHRGTGFNAARQRAEDLSQVPFARPALLGYLAQLENLAQRLATEFPEMQAEKAVLDGDIKVIKKTISDKYP